jgi:hypothetical protein
VIEFDHGAHGQDNQQYGQEVDENNDHDGDGEDE